MKSFIFAITQSYNPKPTLDFSPTLQKHIWNPLLRHLIFAIQKNRIPSLFESSTSENKFIPKYWSTSPLN